ncbi:MAG TPA: GNAT family N-acetyltransferase [Gemmatimonadaceae bacterium]
MPAETRPPRRAVEIRRARPDDADAIAELITQLGYPTTAPEVPERLAALDAESDALLLAVDGESALGLMGLHRHRVAHRRGPVAYITLMVIASGARGNGVGRRLVEAAEAWARDRGCERLTVTSHEDRAGAHAFYQRCGIPYTGRRFSKTLD